MSNYYNLDGIITALEKELRKTEAYIEACEKVTFPTKKDGTPFKQISKNIKGATYAASYYSINPQSRDLTVHTGHLEGIGYTYDSIPCSEVIRYMKDKNKLAKTENYAEKISYLEQLYIYDLDDIKEAIKNKIIRLQHEKESLKKQIVNVEHIYKQFKTEYGNAEHKLKEECNALSNGYDEGISLYYMILNTVKEYYPYC